jgi:hypothetical protein
MKRPLMLRPVLVLAAVVLGAVQVFFGGGQ